MFPLSVYTKDINPLGHDQHKMNQSSKNIDSFEIDKILFRTRKSLVSIAIIEPAKLTDFCKEKKTCSNII